jgi:gliding motility-associated-like protein
MGSSLRAQTPTSSIINSTGSSNTFLGIAYEWSVGELALIETMVGSNYVLSNGLLQPYKISFDAQNDFNIVVNNIITPNGDGINDVWVFQNLDEYSAYEVTLFDRNGSRVFSTKNYQNDWDGKLSNNNLPEDTYYYIIKLVKFGKTGYKNGYVTIAKD